MPRARLPLSPDFSFDRTVRSHGWYDLPPFDYDRKKAELRTVIPTGAGETEVVFRPTDGVLEAAGATSATRLQKLAIRVFSLDLDGNGAASALARDPRLASALARGGGRMLRGASAFEDAVKMLLTTNCSWAATRGMVARLIQTASGRAFPGPESIARVRVSMLRSHVRSGYRSEPLSRFARRVASGRLDLSRWEEPERPAEEIREEILKEPGFGPYAAEGLLRILGRHDFLAVDSWVRQKYRKLYPGPAKATDRSIAHRYRPFGRFQGLALWLDMTRDWHSGAEALWP